MCKICGSKSLETVEFCDVEVYANGDVEFEMDGGWAYCDDYELKGTNDIVICKECMLEALENLYALGSDEIEKAIQNYIKAEEEE